ncbi:GNAT family N-acetyltransferase [Algoriphagus aquatilis]|uniref:GNAT family N-acetyltransferase n=1 Tax=Algoriphagus aquatilis TaxID=490186 RepID=A0ABW0BRA3_9BACT
MIIRQGTDSDLQEVIALLKISLGEDRIPKTEALWNWKHRQNPFGPSPVLVAESAGKIIGVRAFLKWEYIHESKILLAQRAVDTAVHPDFQGKGIFSQLTRKLLEKSRLEGTDLIFNTPNRKSTPGYLKLGWEKWDPLPIKIKPLFFRAHSLGTDPRVSWEEADHLVAKLEGSELDYTELKTHLVKGYLHWRYRDCPIVDYRVISDLHSYLLIYRTKDSKWGKELRICDFFSLGNLDLLSLSSQLKELEKIEKPRFITVSGLHTRKELPSFWKFSPSLPLGPLVTLKQLNPQLQPLNLPWSWSLGDLEVF